MTNYSFVFPLPKPDVAGILTAIGYALREEITLLDAWEEMGFGGVDSIFIESITSDRQLTLLGLYCIIKLLAEVTND